MFLGCHLKAKRSQVSPHIQLAPAQIPWDVECSDGGAIPIITCTEGGEPEDVLGKGRIAEGERFTRVTPGRKG